MTRNTKIMIGSIYMLLALFLSSMMAFATQPRLEFGKASVTVFSAQGAKSEISEEPFLTRSTDEVGIISTDLDNRCPIMLSPLAYIWNDMLRKVQSEADTAAGFGFELIPATENYYDYVPFDSDKISLEDGTVIIRQTGPGKYYFIFKAWFINDPQKAHILTLMVDIYVEGPKCAYVKGKVTLPPDVALDANGNRRKVKVTMCNLTLPPALVDHILTTNMFDTIGVFKHIAMTDDDGNYELYIPEGKFKLYYECKDLNVKNYYPYEFSFYKAEEIQIACGNTKVLNTIDIGRYVNPDTLKCAKVKGVIKLDNCADMALVKIVARPTENNPLYALYPELIVKTYPRRLDTLMKFLWSMDIPKGEYNLQVFRWDSLLYSQVINTACNTTTEIPFIDATLNDLPMDQREYKLNINAFDATTNKKLAVDVWLLPSKENQGAIYCYPLKCKLSENESVINVPIEWLKTFSRFSEKKREILILVGDKIWGRNQYKTMYYNQVYTSTEAELVRLDETFDNDREFNFPLVKIGEKPKEIKHKITGCVANDTTRIQCLINLIKKPEVSGEKFKFLNTPTDDEGNFTFEEVIPGRYLLFAVPLQGSYMPGFYKEGESAVTTWDNATEIVIPTGADESIVKNCQINLHSFDPNNGNGKIAGKVAGNSVNGKLVADGVTSSDAALKGVFMSIFDDIGNAIRSGETDKNGKFSFENLLPGTYKVSASMYGYKSLTQTITIGYKDDDKDFSGALFVLEEAMSDVQEAKAEVSIYPNPAKAMINIDFQAQAGNATISISDALGNIVFSNNIATIDGANNYKYNTQSMPNGLYVITITLDNGKAMSTLLNIVK